MRVGLQPTTGLRTLGRPAIPRAGQGWVGRVVTAASGNGSTHQSSPTQFTTGRAPAVDPVEQMAVLQQQIAAVTQLMAAQATQNQQLMSTIADLSKQVLEQSRVIEEMKKGQQTDPATAIAVSAAGVTLPDTSVSGGPDASTKASGPAPGVAEEPLALQAQVAAPTHPPPQPTDPQAHAAPSRSNGPHPGPAESAPAVQGQAGSPVPVATHRVNVSASKLPAPPSVPATLGLRKPPPPPPPPSLQKPDTSLKLPAPAAAPARADAEGRRPQPPRRERERGPWAAPAPAAVAQDAAAPSGSFSSTGQWVKRDYGRRTLTPADVRRSGQPQPQQQPQPAVSSSASPTDSITQEQVPAQTSVSQDATQVMLAVSTESLPQAVLLAPSQAAPAEVPGSQATVAAGTVPAAVQLQPGQLQLQPPQPPAQRPAVKTAGRKRGKGAGKQSPSPDKTLPPATPKDLQPLARVPSTALAAPQEPHSDAVTTPQVATQPAAATAATASSPAAMVAAQPVEPAASQPAAAAGAAAADAGKAGKAKAKQVLVKPWEPVPATPTVEWLAGLIRSDQLLSPAMAASRSSQPQPATAAVAPITAGELDSLLSKARASLQVTRGEDLVTLLTWLGDSHLTVAPARVGDLVGAVAGAGCGLSAPQCAQCVRALATLGPDMTTPLSPFVMDPSHKVSFGQALCQMIGKASSALSADAALGVASDAQQVVTVAGGLCGAVLQLAQQQPGWWAAQGEGVRVALAAVLSRLGQSDGVVPVAQEHVGCVLDLLSALSALGLTALVPGQTIDQLTTSVAPHVPTLPPSQLVQFATAAAALSQPTQPQPNTAAQSASPSHWAAAVEAASGSMLESLALPEAAALADALATAGHTPSPAWVGALLASTQPQLAAMAAEQEAASSPAKGAAKAASGAAAKGKGAEAAEQSVADSQSAQAGSQLAASVASFQRQPDAAWLASLAAAVGLQFGAMSPQQLLDALWGLCSLGVAPSSAALYALHTKSLAALRDWTPAARNRAACLVSMLTRMQPTTTSTPPTPQYTRWCEELQRTLLPDLPTLTTPQLSDLLPLLQATRATTSAPGKKAGKDTAAKRGAKQTATTSFADALLATVAQRAGEWADGQVVEWVHAFASLQPQPEPASLSVRTAADMADAVGSVVRLCERYQAALGAEMADLAGDQNSAVAVASARTLVAARAFLTAWGQVPGTAWKRMLVRVCTGSDPASLDLPILRAAMADFEEGQGPYEWVQRAAPTLQSDRYLRSCSLRELVATCDQLQRATGQVSDNAAAVLVAKLPSEVKTLDAEALIQALWVARLAPQALRSESVEKACLEQWANLWPTLSFSEQVYLLEAWLAVFGMLPAELLAGLDDACHGLMATDGATPKQVYTLLKLASAVGHVPAPERMGAYASALLPLLPQLPGGEVALVLSTLIDLQFKLDDPWMDAWQSTWRQHVSTQGLGTLAVVFSALSRLGTNQGPGTLVPDAYDASFIDTLRRLDQCLHAPDAASTLTAPDLALWFTTLCSFELGPPPNPVSEAGIDQAELTLRCLALLPGALQAELDVSAPGAPSALGRPKLEAEFLGALAVATMSDDGLEVGSLAHAARGVWVALEAWYTRHAPVAVTLMLLSYLDFSQQVEHRVGVGLLEAVVAQLVARGLKQERTHELDSMLRGNAYWYEVSEAFGLCQTYAEQLPAQCLDRWKSVLANKLREIEASDSLAMPLRTLTAIIPAVYALGLPVSHLWQHRVSSTVIQELVRDPYQVEAEALPMLLSCVRLQQEDGGKGDIASGLAVEQQLLLGALACRLFGTAPSGFMEGYRQVLEEQAVAVAGKAAGDADALVKQKAKGKRGADAAVAAAAAQPLPADIQERVRGMVDRRVKTMPQHMQEAGAPTMQAEPTVLVECLRHVLRMNTLPDRAWLTTMCTAILPTLDPPGSKLGDPTTAWSVASLSYMLHTLQMAAYHPGMPFLQRAAACTKRVLQEPGASVEPAQAGALISGLCMGGYHPGNDVLAEIYRVSLPSLHELTYLDYVTGSAQSGGEGTRDQSAARAGPAGEGGARSGGSATAAGTSGEESKNWIVIDQMLGAMVPSNVVASTEWLTEMCRVMTSVSRHVPHTPLARTAGLLAVLVGRDLRNLPSYEPHLSVLLMELLTRISRAKTAQVVQQGEQVQAAYLPPTPEQVEELTKGLQLLQMVLTSPTAPSAPVAA